MKYTFRHTAIIDHEIEADNIPEAKQKLLEEVLEKPDVFFQKASNIITDERIKILNENGDMIDAFNFYDI